MLSKQQLTYLEEFGFEGVSRSDDPYEVFPKLIKYLELPPDSQVSEVYEAFFQVPIVSECDVLEPKPTDNQLLRQWRRKEMRARVSARSLTAKQFMLLKCFRDHGIDPHNEATSQFFRFTQTEQIDASSTEFAQLVFAFFGMHEKHFRWALKKCFKKSVDEILVKMGNEANPSLIADNDEDATVEDTFETENKNTDNSGKRGNERLSIAKMFAKADRISGPPECRHPSTFGRKDPFGRENVFRPCEPFPIINTQSEQARFASMAAHNPHFLSAFEEYRWLYYSTGQRWGFRETKQVARLPEAHPHKPGNAFAMGGYPTAEFHRSGMQMRQTSISAYAPGDISFEELRLKYYGDKKKDGFFVPPVHYPPSDGPIDTVLGGRVIDPLDRDVSAEQLQDSLEKGNRQLMELLSTAEPQKEAEDEV